MTDKPVLFLLPPGFAANGRREFCPECAELWGVLSYYPAIREALDIVYVGIEHPRQPICALLGEGRHNAPTLVLPAGASVPAFAEQAPTGRAYLGRARLIAAWFATQYGTAMPRGTEI